ncbi:hypothetical protein ACJX0J_008643, partial [Zea mays]
MAPVLYENEYIFYQQLFGPKLIAWNELLARLEVLKLMKRPKKTKTKNVEHIYVWLGALVLFITNMHGVSDCEEPVRFHAGT